MKTHDLIAQENEAFDHFNTGAFYLGPDIRAHAHALRPSRRLDVDAQEHCYRRGVESSAAARPRQDVARSEQLQRGTPLSPDRPRLPSALTFPRSR